MKMAGLVPRKQAKYRQNGLESWRLRWGETENAEAGKLRGGVEHGFAGILIRRRQCLVGDGNEKKGANVASAFHGCRQRLEQARAVALTSRHPHSELSFVRESYFA